MYTPIYTYVFVRMYFRVYMYACLYASVCIHACMHRGIYVAPAESGRFRIQLIYRQFKIQCQRVREHCYLGEGVHLVDDVFRWRRFKADLGSMVYSLRRKQTQRQREIKNSLTGTRAVWCIHVDWTVQTERRRWRRHIDTRTGAQIDRQTDGLVSYLDTGTPTCWHTDIHIVYRVQTRPDRQTHRVVWQACCFLASCHSLMLRYESLTTHLIVYLKKT